MPATMNMHKPVEQKRVTISSKRQFTIPQKFFTELGFEREAICTLGDGILIIEPAPHESGGEFAEQILEELVGKGLTGQTLLDEFKSRQAKIRTGVEALLEAAKAASRGEGEYYTIDEIFGEE